jgi:hypothetical protein
MIGKTHAEWTTPLLDWCQMLKRPVPETLHGKRQKGQNQASSLVWLRVCLGIGCIVLLTHCKHPTPAKKRLPPCPQDPPGRVVSLRVELGTPQNRRPVHLEKREIESAVRSVLSKQKGFVLDLSKRGRCGLPFAVSIDLDFRQIVFGKKGRASILIAMVVRRAEKQNAAEIISRGEARKVYTVARTPNLRSFYLDLLRKGVGDVFRYVVIERRLKDAPPPVVAAAIETGLFDPNIDTHTLRPASWQPPMATAFLLAVPGLGPAAAYAGLHGARQTPTPLASDAAEIQEMAIRAAALRKLKGVTPSLLHVLKFGTRSRLRDQALGALVEIGDRGVVEPLVRYARFHGEGSTRNIIEALAQLGGPKARSFLDLTANGHPDREIRKMARSALKTMK